MSLASNLRFIVFLLAVAIQDSHSDQGSYGHAVINQKPQGIWRHGGSPSHPSRKKGTEEPTREEERDKSHRELPNIVFVLADDLGYNDIGYHNKHMNTPALDELAKSGVILENYYVQPICTPTRSQLMSGRYQIHTGLQHGVIKPEQANGLPLDHPTIADQMKKAGYSTAMVGKWHLGFYKEDSLPWKRGFDTFFGYLTGSENYYTHKRKWGFGRNHGSYLDLRDETGPVTDQHGTYSTHLFTQRAIQCIENHDQQNPLFLYLAYQAVHGPLQVPKKYLKQYKDKDYTGNRRIYSGMVTAMDEGVDNVTNALKKAGMWENTVFIFSTDNGGRKSEGGNNFPLKGEKYTLWEGGMRGVGFVSGGRIKASDQANRELIHVSDWYPTLMALAGIDAGPDLMLDGWNQWPTINGEKESPRQTLLHNIDPLFKHKGSRYPQHEWDTRVRAAVRSGSYKLITGNPERPGARNDNNENSFICEEGQENPDDPETTQDPDKVMGRTSQHTTAEKSKGPKSQHDSVDVTNRNNHNKNVWLFNVIDDPSETNDLSETEPDKVIELLNLLVEFNKTAVPVRFPKRDPNSDPSGLGGVFGPWL